MNVIKKFLQEENRWKKEVKGNLSDASVSRMKKAGVGKSANDYLRGFHTATLNQLKKMGAEITNIPEPGMTPELHDMVYSGVRPDGTKFVYIPKDIKNPNSKFNTLFKTFDKDYKWSEMKIPILRHELDEVKLASRLVDKWKKNPPRKMREDPFGIKRSFDQMMGKPGANPGFGVYKNNQMMGQHISPRVLKREKDYTTFQDRYYGVGKSLRNMRQSTGEDVIQNMSNKQIKAIEKEIEKELSYVYNVPYDKNVQQEVNKRVESIWKRITGPAKVNIQKLAKTIAAQVSQSYKATSGFVKKHPVPIAAGVGLAATAGALHYMNQRKQNASNPEVPQKSYKG